MDIVLISMPQFVALIFCMKFSYRELLPFKHRAGMHFSSF
uniref:Uncharacterized protein n=1 Tax=Arundo donax TaxID=35708 RepID=A0A0A8ZPR0_ARUDO